MSDYDDDYADDDFEDYSEEEFEEYDEEEDERQEESQRASAGQATPPPAAAAPGLNLGVGEEEKYLRKLRKERWKVLKETVELQEVALDNLFVMPPYSLRQLQEMGCGVFKERLEKATSGEVCEAKRVQTDRISVRQKNTQFPDAEAGSNWRNALLRVKVMKSRLFSNKKTNAILESSSQKRLTNFVLSSGKIMEKLLAENERRNFQTMLQGTQDREVGADAADATGGNATIASSLFKLSLESYFGRRPIQGLCFSKDLPPYLAVALGPKEGDKENQYQRANENEGGDRSPDALNSCSVLSVWNLEAMDTPVAVCVSSGEVSSLCFGPSTQHLSSIFLVAGMTEGGLCLWDCGEPESMHERCLPYKRKDEGRTLAYTARWPSYTTEAQADFNHAEEIVSVTYVPKPKGESSYGHNPNRNAGDQGGDHAASSVGCQFRVVSLNRLGMAMVWDVCDIPFADNLSQVAGTDLGLRIGSRYKMLKKTVIDLVSLTSDMRGGLSFEDRNMMGITSFCAADDDLTTLAVGTAQGVVYKCNRFGTKSTPPRYFSPIHREENFESGKFSPVLALQFSPHDPSLLLSCHLDGSICLYRTTMQPLPVKNWIGSCAILQVQWSPRDQNVFFALDSSSTLHCWNMLEDQSQPTHSQHLVTQDEAEHADCYATSFAVNIPEGLGGTDGSAGVVSVPKQSFLSVSYSNGRAKIFLLKA